MSSLFLRQTGEQSALGEGLFWAERVGVEAYGNEVARVVIDYHEGWPKLRVWAENITLSDVPASRWAALWAGIATVPNWPEDDVEPERWGCHLPAMGCQLRLGLRICARRLYFVDGVGQRPKALIGRMLAGAREACGADFPAFRVSFHRESLAVQAERNGISSAKWRTAHLALLRDLPSKLSLVLSQRRNRPSVQKLRAIKASST